MKCCAGVGLLAAGVLGSSRHSETTRPFLTSETARRRFAASMRFIAPFSSSAPQRPQLLWLVRKSRYSCLVGAGCSGMGCLLLRLWRERILRGVLLSPHPLPAAEEGAQP